MNIAVRFLSYSGNTKKIAAAIGQAVGAEALLLERPLEEHTDLLFLGSSLYKFGVDPSVRDFIAHNADRIGKIVLFGTSASGGSTYKQVAEIAAANGVMLCEREFACLGKFLFMHKDRPNADDKASAAAFAREVLQAEGK